MVEATETSALSAQPSIEGSEGKEPPAEQASAPPELVHWFSVGSDAQLEGGSFPVSRCGQLDCAERTLLGRAEELAQASTAERAPISATNPWQACEGGGARNRTTSPSVIKVPDEWHVRTEVPVSTVEQPEAWLSNIFSCFTERERSD